MKKVVKNIISIGSAIIGLNILIITVVIIKLLLPCKIIVPDRPDTVPVSAVWYGGCDGGYWYEFVENRQDTLRMRIYSDSGYLCIDADYVSIDSTRTPPKESEWNQFEYYSWDDDVQCINPQDNSSLELIMVYPVYYPDYVNTKHELELQTSLMD